MSKMYIMNDCNLGDGIEGVLWPLVEETGRFEGVAADFAPLIAAVDDPSYQEPVSIYETDPEMAEHSDEVHRELILFGMAFEDKWCKDDVYIIMVHDGGRAWVQHY